jgi:hypothetical protein
MLLMLGNILHGKIAGGCPVKMFTFLTSSAEIGFPSLSMAPSATRMIFSLKTLSTNIKSR